MLRQGWRHDHRAKAVAFFPGPPGIRQIHRLVLPTAVPAGRVIEPGVLLVCTISFPSKHPSGNFPAFRIPAHRFFHRITGLPPDHPVPEGSVITCRCPGPTWSSRSYCAAAPGLVQPRTRSNQRKCQTPPPGLPLPQETPADPALMLITVETFFHCTSTFHFSSGTACL